MFTTYWLGDGAGTGDVMERLEGETIAWGTLREDRHAEARPRVAAPCCTFLASLHALPRRGIEGTDGS